MSGPKFVTYTVETEAQRRAREHALLRGEAFMLAEREALLRRQAQAARARYGEAVDTVPALAAVAVDTPSEELGVHVSERRRELDALERRQSAQIDAARRASLMATLAGTVTASAAPAPAPPPRRRGTPAAAPRSAPPIATEVERILGALAPAVTAATASELERVAARALAETAPGRAEAALADLRTRVQLANEDAAAAAVRRSAVEHWRGRLGGLRHPEARRALAELASAEDGRGDLPPAMVALLEEAAQAGERALDDAYVATSVAATLRDLGYDVAEGFATLLAERGFADATNPRWRGYAVRVRRSATGQDLRFNVVRGGDAADASRRRDAEVEEEWCTDVPPLLSELGHAGIAARLAGATPAGAVPVQVVEDLAAAAPISWSQTRELSADP